MKMPIVITVILVALPLVIYSAPATNNAAYAGPGLVNRPAYPYPNWQTNYKISDVIPGYSTYNTWNVTDNLQFGATCIENYNCTSKYCNQDTGYCISPCKYYQLEGNSSNGCYCEANSECSSNYCDWKNRECKTRYTEDQVDGLYCDQDWDCGYGSNGIQAFSNPGGSKNYIATPKTLTAPSYTYSSLDVWSSSVCDYQKHQCVPRCKIGGCFCTRNNNCDSYICYKNYCKPISYVPAWTLCIGISIIIFVSVVIVVYRVKFSRKYLISNIPPTYAVVEGSSVKPPEFSTTPQNIGQVAPK